jgi:hypothetical protein
MPSNPSGTKRILLCVVVVVLIVGGFVFWQLYQQHLRNVETGEQMLRNARRMGQ